MAEYKREELDAMMRRYSEELMRLRPRTEQVQAQTPAPVPAQPQEIPGQPTAEAVFAAPLPEFPEENRAPFSWNGNSLPAGEVLRDESAEYITTENNPLIRREDEPPEQGVGTLTVTVRTAEGALPVQGAAVTITDERYGGSRLAASVTTNADGMTPMIYLPAPLSAQDVKNVAYAVYTVEVLADGYLPERIADVGVLSGQGGVLPVLLKPAPINLVVPEQVEYSSMPEF